MTRDAIRDHLEFFGELGIDGMRLEPEWRSRAERSVQLQPDPELQDPAPAKAGEGPAKGGEGPAKAGHYIALTQVDALDALRIDIGPDCSRCKLHTLGRTQVVFGVGNPNADLMFVGEAPGADEDIKGEPFVGRAGQLLTKIIEAIDLRREDVYIANVIKCRPPGNRNPEPDEVEQCEPFLFRQVDIIRPKVIVALGKFAAQCLLKTDAPITRIRGREFTYRDSVLIPTYHPAYLLRNPSAKRDVWEDMKKVRAILMQSADE
ncbi:MAG TPA: uracil-DNA glycosylase [Vicinamibacterales bacterium]|nr:uracil-DNA glycosylase [Vicinamibacterales bacterium]